MLEKVTELLNEYNGYLLHLSKCGIKIKYVKEPAPVTLYPCLHKQ